MPYFPERSAEAPYKCQGCGGWFFSGNISCCVAHAPGTCCHLGEQPSTPGRTPEGTAAQMERLGEEDEVTQEERDEQLGRIVREEKELRAEVAFLLVRVAEAAHEIEACGKALREWYEHAGTLDERRRELRAIW